MRELCRLHNVPLPPDIDNLTIPFQLPPPNASPLHQHPAAAENHSIDGIDSDPEEQESEAEQESEGDEDLPLEMDDGRNTNKVCYIIEH